VGTTTAATGTNTQYSLVQIAGNSAGGANFGALNILRNEDSANITSGENIGQIEFGDRQAGEYARIRVVADGTAGSGGSGGGGAGSNSGNGTAGTVNTGSGGGGGGPGGSVPSSNGGAGGSGIVIIRAPSARTLGASPGTNTVATLPAPAGGCKVATFTVSGDLTIS
jgi:hypothetical protein